MFSIAQREGELFLDIYESKPGVPLDRVEYLVSKIRGKVPGIQRVTYSGYGVKMGHLFKLNCDTYSEALGLYMQCNTTEPYGPGWERITGVHEPSPEEMKRLVGLASQ